MSATATLPANRITPARPAAHRAVRLTVAGRRVLLGLGALLLALVLVLASDLVQAEAGGTAPPTAGHVVVQPGQTLWDVAAVNAPAGMDVRAYLLELQHLNGVRADDVAAWDVLLLPVLP